MARTRSSPGRAYHGRIFFAKIVDFDDTAYGGGVAGVAAFLAETGFPVRTTGGTDNQQPNLEAQSPFNGQSGIEGNAVVSFTFSEPMNTALVLGASIVWSGNVNGGQVGYTWSADGRTLFCVYGPGFPTDAEISWQLNPAGSPENLRDLAGNKLLLQSGLFSTGSQSGAGERDVDFLAFVKGRSFRQTSSVAESAQLNFFSLTSDLNAYTNFNGFTASFEFHDNVPPGGRRFYRAREGSDFGGGP